MISTNAQPTLWDNLPPAPHNGTETSRAAAYHAAATGQVNRQEREIMWWLEWDAKAQAEADRDGTERVSGLTRKDLARLTGLPESRVGARVNRLVKSGLVREEGTRVPVGGSVRQKVVFATEAGLAAIREAKS
jgi:hypothetical protein